MRMTIEAYQALYCSSVAFGKRTNILNLLMCNIKKKNH